MGEGSRQAGNAKITMPCRVGDKLGNSVLKLIFRRAVEDFFATWMNLTSNSLAFLSVYD